MEVFRERTIFDRAYIRSLDDIQNLLNNTLFKEMPFQPCLIEEGADLRALFVDDEDNRELIKDHQGQLRDGWDKLSDETDKAVFIVDPLFRLHGPCYSKADLFSEALNLRYNSDLEERWEKNACT